MEEPGGPRLASLKNARQRTSKTFKIIQAWLLGPAAIHNHFPGGDCLQRRQNCRTVVLTAHLNLKEANEANHATTFCFAIFCASHSFGKPSSDSPRCDFVRFSPATLRSAPSAQDCGRVTGSFEDHLAQEASISSRFDALDVLHPKKHLENLKLGGANFSFRIQMLIY